MLRRRLVLVLVAVSTALAGCAASPDTTEPLPGGQRLVDAAAEALREVRSVRFEFEVSGVLPGLPVREVEGVATRRGGPHGYARGAADVQTVDERVRYEFVLDGDGLRLTGPEGVRVDAAVPGRFAPARLLDPERGLRALLDEATGLETENREELDDVPTYRVSGELPREAVGALVPGIHADVDVKFWVARHGQRHLMRVWIQVPPRQKNEGAVQLELALSEHNTDIRRPPTVRGAES